MLIKCYSATQFIDNLTDSPNIDKLVNQSDKIHKIHVLFKTHFQCHFKVSWMFLSTQTRSDYDPSYHCALSSKTIKCPNLSVLSSDTLNEKSQITVEVSNSSSNILSTGPTTSAELKMSERITSDLLPYVGLTVLGRNVFVFVNADLGQL